MRRRRLDALGSAPEFPGRARVLAAELARYDHWLVVAAHMIEVHVPEAFPGPGRPVAPEIRALLEDRLSQAGLNVFLARHGPQGLRRRGGRRSRLLTLAPFCVRKRCRHGGGQRACRPRRTSPCARATTPR